MNADETRPILLVGAGGQLGRELATRLARIGRTVTATRSDVDLERPADIRAFVGHVRPALVVNAAAYTAVDDAERDAARCTRLNADAPAVLAEASMRLGAPLVHFSTNYVFDGTKDGAYTEDDAPSPSSVYGATKLAGEQHVAAANPRHLILRTAAVYGRHGRNFMNRILELAREREELRVVDDQYIAPTPAWLLADAAVKVIARLSDAAVPSGVFHVTTRGATSWYAFAERILAADLDRGAQRVRSLVPVPTTEFPTPARRPANGVLDVTKFERSFHLSLLEWKVALTQTVAGTESWS